MPDDTALPVPADDVVATSIPRPVDDHYRSPPECMRALMSVVDLSAGLHECCAGDGILAAVAADQLGAGAVTASTILPPAETYFAVEQQDFLQLGELRQPWIVTNPPYSKMGGKTLRNAGAAVAIITHALQLLEDAGDAAKGLCCLMDVRFALSEARNKPGGLLYERPATFIHSFQDRVTMYPAGTPMNVRLRNGTNSYGWLVWLPPFRRPGGHSLFTSMLNSRVHRQDGDRERFRLPLLRSR
ncbi:hypothetical protein GBZ48_31620 [Azospirillum melinis]|uniref:Methyltransferase n=1 Tax=Azospirillum melinis TaxID=328839 RepID=A0ABX2KN02_9PROT|nr:hypothetical protein [Azospirillum melinis]MBP2310474.1 hypothetical protein [Azospirillum melinis]NUB03766.1 hypothetical protein [Azospirillum melinis]